MSKNNINIKRLKRQVLSHVGFVRIVILSISLILCLIVGAFVYQAVAGSVFGQAVGLGRNFLVPSSHIKTSDGRVNVLLLGKGGPGHEGPDLTDTMLLASISTSNHNMTLISIPRDIWIQDLKDKINSAYMYGKQKEPNGGGLLLAKSTVEEVLGIQIDYGFVLDFGGFKDVIDALGGVTVDVKNGFTDKQYPIEGKENDKCNGDITFACRYTTISFKPGVQTMDADTALIYVRSRHGDNNEGNDIAREARQQLVIAAIMKKVSTPQIFTNFSIDVKLLKVLEKSLETDLMPNEEAALVRYVINAKGDIKSYTIPDNLLYNPPNQYKYFNSLYTHAFVFIPNNKQSISGNTEDWSDVAKWVQSILL